LCAINTLFYLNLATAATLKRTGAVSSCVMKLGARIGRAGFTLGFIVLSHVAVAQGMDISVLKGRWVLEIVDGKRVNPDGNEIYFEVTEQAVTGYDGCNRFGVSISKPSAAIGGQRGCLPEAKKLPINPIELVAQLQRAVVKGDTLVLPLLEGKGEAQFRRSP